VGTSFYDGGGVGGNGGLVQEAILDFGFWIGESMKDNLIQKKSYDFALQIPLRPKKSGRPRADVSSFSLKSIPPSDMMSSK